MKIFVNARFLTQPLSGVQRYGIECSRQIKKLYRDAVFLCPQNIIHHEFAAELAVKTIGKNTGHLWEQLDLPGYLAAQDNAPLLNLANTAPIRYKNNYITIHDLAFYHHPEWNSRMFSLWYNTLIPRLAHKSTHIFTVSETIREEIVKYYEVPPDKVSVTYNGISAAMLAHPKPPGIRKEKIILSVGSFNKRKNHQNLVSAFLQSKIKGEYQLAIVGDRSKVFKESNLDERLLQESNIKIYQRFTEPELIAMYHKAEVLVSLSMYEGFGIPLLEGLYNECKVVCSDIPVYHELFDGYANFCDPLDIGHIASALEYVTKAKPQTHAQTNIDALLSKYNYECSAQVILGKILG